MTICRKFQAPTRSRIQSEQRNVDSKISRSLISIGSGDMRVIKPRYYSLIVSAVLVFGALAHAAEDDFSRSIRFGTEEAQQGNLSAALADLRAAVNLEPNNSTGWYELGLVLGQVADFRAAEAA